VQRNRQGARLPVAGTIRSRDPSKAQFNMPYPYPNSNDGYEAAGLNLKSPIAMTEATVEQGKVIYTKFCLHCHGEKGEGDGGVVKNGNYPTPPSYTAALKDLSEGKIFHSDGLWEEPRDGLPRFAIEQGGALVGGTLREVPAGRWEDAAGDRRSDRHDRRSN
jgi:mono/diheme cytochrome c family protein